MQDAAPWAYPRLIETRVRRRISFLGGGIVCVPHGRRDIGAVLADESS
jgi:hypothetical protein